MKKVTKEEKMLIFNDLMHYYQFCKHDRRNHMFNAIRYGKRYKKESVPEEYLEDVRNAFDKAKDSYSYYMRMKTVALLLRLNLIDFITIEEKTQAFKDLIAHYRWRIYTKLHYVKVIEKKLAEVKTSDTNQVEDFKFQFQTNKAEVNKYVLKLDIVKKVRNEIIK